jgi:hypothetical protein
MEEFLNSTFNVSKSGINSVFNAFIKKRKTALSKLSLTKTTKVFSAAGSGSAYWKTFLWATGKSAKAPFFMDRSPDFRCKGLILNCIGIYQR